MNNFTIGRENYRESNAQFALDKDAILYMGTVPGCV